MTIKKKTKVKTTKVCCDLGQVKGQLVNLQVGKVDRSTHNHDKGLVMRRIARLERIVWLVVAIGLGVMVLLGSRGLLG